MLQEELQKLKERAFSELKKISDASQLQNFEIKYLGRKGELTKILRSVGELPEKERGEMGNLANQIKQALASEIGRIKKSLGGKEAGGPEKEWIDVTASKPRRRLGHLHPISQIQYELEDLFASMGFIVLDGPELESEYYNFEALNIPPHHPAREMQDTFYVGTQMDTEKPQKNTELLMRTHTSSMQVRAMEKYGTPLRAIFPGRCFRNEATDASHEHTFYQMEGLMVDKNISIANLISVMKALLRGIFKRDVKVRLRSGYFPFVEPGFELDVNCLICGGKGCSVCKHSGWLEILPCGMVHPNVLKFGGIDPKEWSGFAFGLGLTRLTMMKYGINDIRLFCGGDLRFLNQF
jgi:phenylalanyl-tRNA synthetase alpha chain